jgi:hypothetical protein
MEDVSIVDIQDRKKQMIDSLKALPWNIAVVEGKLRHDALSLIGEGAPVWQASQRPEKDGGLKGPGAIFLTSSPGHCGGARKRPLRVMTKPLYGISN